jgi:hypothetical protein
VQVQQAERWCKSTSPSPKTAKKQQLIDHLLAASGKPPISGGNEALHDTLPKAAAIANFKMIALNQKLHRQLNGERAAPEPKAMTLPEIRKELEKLGLNSKGLKRVVAKRLEDHKIWCQIKGE